MNVICTTSYIECFDLNKCQISTKILSCDDFSIQQYELYIMQLSLDLDTKIFITEI